MIVPRQTMPASPGLPSPMLWIGGISSALAAWVGLILGLRREFRERTILRFSLFVTRVEADEEDQSRTFFEGTAVIDAIGITLTNMGSHPVTIKHCGCLFLARTSGGETVTRKIQKWPNAKLGLGDAETIYLKMAAKPVQFLQIVVTDSTDKTWKTPRQLVSKLHESASERWDTIQLPKAWYALRTRSR